MTVAEYVLLGRTPHLGYFGREGGARPRGRGRRARPARPRRASPSRRLGTLSGGERQRAVLARALAQQAPILLLDEPTNALDVGRGQQALELVDQLRREAGLTVLAAMHDLTLAGQYADRLLLLDRGRVVAAGGVDEVLTDELISRHYDASVRVLRDEDGRGGRRSGPARLAAVQRVAISAPAGPARATLAAAHRPSAPGLPVVHLDVALLEAGLEAAGRRRSSRPRSTPPSPRSGGSWTATSCAATASIPASRGPTRSIFLDLPRRTGLVGASSSGACRKRGARGADLPAGCSEAFDALVHALDLGLSEHGTARACSRSSAASTRRSTSIACARTPKCASSSSRSSPGRPRPERAPAVLRRPVREFTSSGSGRGHATPASRAPAGQSPSSTSRRQPSSSASVHENQRFGSRSGQTTAARTPATTSSSSPPRADASGCSWSQRASSVDPSRRRPGRSGRRPRRSARAASESPSAPSASARARAGRPRRATGPCCRGGRSSIAQPSSSASMRSISARQTGRRARLPRR